MKIQTKLMLYIGGTAAAITILVLSLGSFRLNSILKKIDAQNDKLFFERMASGAEAAAVLENALANLSVERLFSSLRQFAAKHSDASAVELQEALRDSIETCDPSNCFLILERSAPGGGSAELDALLVRRETGRFSAESMKIPKGSNIWERIVSQTEPELIYIDEPTQPLLKNQLFAAIALPSAKGRPARAIAYSLTPETLLKALRPKSKEFNATAMPPAIYAVADAKGKMLLSAVAHGLRSPKSIFELAERSLLDAAEKKDSPQLMRSKLSLAFHSGGFMELAPQGEEGLWLMEASSLQVELAGSGKLKLLKIFPHPANYSDTDLARSVQANIDDLLAAVSFIALFGLLLFLPPLFLIAKGISEPLASAVAFANSLAKGDFPPNSLKMSGSSEIAGLGRSLTHMRDRLGNTISKLKKSHEREMLARKDAEAANHLKSDFLANMSLELRNPLNSIMGFSSLILKDVEKGLYDEQLKGKAKAIFEGAESLNGLVATLLDLSKLDTANVELRPREFETSTLMRELVEAALPSAAEKGITIENHFSPDTPAKLFTDRELLAHTLGLLVSSLIRSTPGGRKVSLGCFCSGAKLVFFVKDAKEQRPGDSLAEMYLRYSLSQTELLPTFAGTTLLNITIAKNQAHILGSDFESEAGGSDSNSCFTISFAKNEVMPAVGSETSSIHTASNWRNTTRPGTQTDIFPAIRKAGREPGTPIHILMAEDNEANRMLVELMLADENYSLESVNDGEACLKALAAKRFELLLLDLHMPHLDGYSVINRIRQDRALDNMPIIVLTAYLEEGDKERLLQMGASKCILKPINIDELLNSIRAFAG